MFLSITHEIPSGAAARSATTTAVTLSLDPRSSTAAEHTPDAARTGSPAFSARPFRTTSTASSLLNTSYSPSHAIIAKSPSTARCVTSGSARTIRGPLSAGAGSFGRTSSWTGLLSSASPV
jgi:hypothetical protein